MFLIALLREENQVLVNLLCYVEISENDFFNIIYVLCHKNSTKT